jgi:uncharacterized membrane protein
MPNTDPKDAPTRRPPKNSVFLIALIIAAVIIVAVQYTPYAMFSADKTSTLWGMLTGLIIGGVLFGWLKFRKGEDGTWFD